MSLKEKPQVGGWDRFLAFSVAGVFLIVVIAYFFYGLQPSLAKEGPVTFKISKGESFRSIGARLSREELVRSISVFKMYALFTGKVQSFKPGVYTLGSNMSIPELVSILTAVGANEIVVTVPEGVTLKDTDRLLAKAGVIEESDLLKFRLSDLSDEYPFLMEASNLEGFLFPDTYRFEVGTPIELVVKRFLDNFEAKAWPILESRKNWYEDLRLASYLEREVPDFNDRAVVAGILLKRLKIGMPLQVDATLSYAKCNGRLLGCENIKVIRGDLTMSSPYNTYQRLGWTPTPIANPGQAAIKAAVSPQKSSYLFYLSAKTGETVFSKTLDEHNDNKFKYL